LYLLSAGRPGLYQESCGFLFKELVPLSCRITPYHLTFCCLSEGKYSDPLPSPPTKTPPLMLVNVVSADILLFNQLCHISLISTCSSNERMTDFFGHSFPNLLHPARGPPRSPHSGPDILPETSPGQILQEAGEEVRGSQHWNCYQVLQRCHDDMNRKHFRSHR